MGSKRSIQRVTVFGGARPPDAAYQQALQLGQLLGAGRLHCADRWLYRHNGGRLRGAAESGAHVIGVTCEEIEAWRTVRPNAWVQEEMRFPTLRQRLFALIEELRRRPGPARRPWHPGGNRYHVEPPAHRSPRPRPLILIGAGWQATFDQFYASLGDYTPEDQRRCYPSPRIQAAVRN